jgi:hypothetical protein
MGLGAGRIRIRISISVPSLDRLGTSRPPLEPVWPLPGPSVRRPLSPVNRG